MVTKVKAQLKKTTKTEVFASGAKIVDDVLLENVLPHNMPDCFPKYINLVRTANRQREREHPKHPRDLQFEVAMDHIPANSFGFRSEGRGKMPPDVCNGRDAAAPAQDRDLVYG